MDNLIDKTQNITSESYNNEKVIRRHNRPYKKD